MILYRIIPNMIAGLLMFAAVLLLWWTFQPTSVTTIEEPIPILNEGKIVKIGDPIIMELKINKTNSYRVVSSTPRIDCVSGNLVTLTGAGVTLPTGEQTRISTSYLMPPKVLDGDQCRFIFQITYEINPIREIVVEWSSEQFKVKE